MNVRITRTRPHVELPTYQTKGSVGFDLAAAADTTVPAHSTAIVPTGLIIATPPGYALLVVARSSTFKKTGLRLANAIGIIDQDYAGPNDEIGIILWNPSATDIVVKQGDRVAQGLFVPVAIAEWQEAEATNAGRGAFGSTGGYHTHS